MNEVGKIRPEFLKESIVYGDKINLFLPTNVQRKGQFAIVDLDDIIASHDHNSFSDSEGYPVDKSGSNINDRNYSGDLSAQAAVKGYAQHLAPERIISTSVEESGTPVISTDGFVVSGNNRTMSLKLASEQFPERYQAYKDRLLDQSSSFGIDPEIMKSIIEGKEISDRTGQYAKKVKFNRPALIRFDYDFPEYTTHEMTFYNKGAMKAEKVVDKTIKLSKILATSEKCTEMIANVIGQYETASEFYNTMRDQKQVADYLVECNILTQQELPAYFENDTFTRIGKDFIENLLAAMVLNEQALIASNKAGVKKFRNTIITSLLVLIKNSNLPEGSLQDDINQALILQSKIIDSELDFKHYMSQSALWDEKISSKAAYLNRLLTLGRNKFKESIVGYNSTIAAVSGSMGMFGDNPDPKEAFEFYIIDKIGLSDRNIIENSPRIIGSEDLDPELNEDKTAIARARARAKIKILQLKNKK